MKRYSLLFLFALIVLSAACSRKAATTAPTVNVPPTAVRSVTQVVPTAVVPTSAKSSSGVFATAADQPASDASPSGDIPDNATYLVYQAPKYSLQYVEGWAREALANDGVRFVDKDSFVSVALAPVPSGTVLDYASTQGTADTTKEFEQFKKTAVKTVTLPAGQAALLTFQALSAPDPVTGTRVTLDVNRYYIAGPKALAILTEATPNGVDNVDSFAQIAQSLTWSGH
ncbi:MAG TPA: hypothetical protein VFD70_18710 [Anaerolineae bacterium]|nr:hypothetical protein [Anaerolineae bacterium]